MTTLLLTIEDAFTVGASRGVLLAPKITLTDRPKEPFNVTLRKPNGLEIQATATIDVSHVQGKLAPFAMYRIHGVTADQIPAGTELHRRDD